MAAHDEVPAGINRAFVQARQLSVRLARQNALSGAQHDWHPSNLDVFLPHSLPASPVVDVDHDGRCVGHVPEPALVRRDRGAHILLTLGPRGPEHPDGVVPIPISNAGRRILHILDPEILIDIAGDDLVGHDDVGQFSVDEVVERVNVLLYQSFDSEKCG